MGYDHKVLLDRNNEVRDTLVSVVQSCVDYILSGIAAIELTRIAKATKKNFETGPYLHRSDAIDATARSLSKEVGEVI